MNLCAKHWVHGSLHDLTSEKKKGDGTCIGLKYAVSTGTFLN